MTPIRRELTPEQQKEFDEARAKLQKLCPHKHERMLTDSGFNSRSCSLTGRVICLDCGREREWDAY